MGKGQRERDDRKVKSVERQTAIEKAQREITATINAIGLLVARTNDLLTAVADELIAKGVITKENVVERLKKVDAMRNDDLLKEAQKRNAGGEENGGKVSQNSSDDSGG